jgi:hypothetical protein
MCPRRPVKGDHSERQPGLIGKHMAQKINITVIVSGTLTVVEANEEAPIGTIIPKALEQTGNTGQPISEWRLRDVDGNLVDTSKKIKDFHFPPTVKLFLSPKTGAGG